MDYWIETFTGKRVNPLHLTKEDIYIVDIAHALSLLCRYTGHCSRFYSVGQHSLHTCYLVSTHEYESEAKKNATCLAALLHDAAEAYLGDIANPVKQQLKIYQEAEKKALGVIFMKFNIGSYDGKKVKDADEEMLTLEAKELMPSKGEGWELIKQPRPNSLISAEPKEVEEKFITAFWKYSK